MMKRNIFLSLTAAVLAMACLFGCSSGSEESSSSASADASSKAASSAASSAVEASAGENGVRDLDAIFESLKSSNPISNPFEIAVMNIEYDFMLKAEDVVQYKGVKSNDNGDAGLVLVIEPAEGKAEAICEALDCQVGDLLRWEPDGADAGGGESPAA